MILKIYGDITWAFLITSTKIIFISLANINNLHSNKVLIMKNGKHFEMVEDKIRNEKLFLCSQWYFIKLTCFCNSISNVINKIYIYNDVSKYQSVVRGRRDDGIIEAEIDCQFYSLMALLHFHCMHCLVFQFIKSII